MEHFTPPGVHGCQTCHGLWVEVQRFEQLLTTPPEQIRGLLFGAFRRSSSAAEKLCPICRTRMVTKEFEDQSRVELDVCSLGHGIWFDRYELQRVLNFRQRKRLTEQLARFERKLNSKRFTISQYQAIASEAQKRARKLKGDSWNRLAKRYLELANLAFDTAAERANEAGLVRLAEEWGGYPQELYTRALRLSPENSRLHYRCGRVRLDSLRDDLAVSPDSALVREALTYFQAAYDRDPAAAPNLCGMAEAWARLGQPDRAFRYLALAHRSGVSPYGPESPPPHALFRVLYGAVTREAWLKSQEQQCPRIIRSQIEKRCLLMQLERCRKSGREYIFPAPMGSFVFDCRAKTIFFRDRELRPTPVGQKLLSARLSSRASAGPKEAQVHSAVFELRESERIWSFEYGYPRTIPARVKQNCERVCGAFGLTLEKRI